MITNIDPETSSTDATCTATPKSHDKLTPTLFEHAIAPCTLTGESVLNAERWKLAMVFYGQYRCIVFLCCLLVTIHHGLLVSTGRNFLSIFTAVGQVGDGEVVDHMFLLNQSLSWTIEKRDSRHST